MASDVVLQAVRQGDLESIKLHISNGKLTTTTRDPLGATCVHMAARNGNLQLLKYLVESAKFPVNLPAENGALATHDAAALGHRGCLEYLLDKGCPLVACDCNGVNLLHLTARFGNLQLLTWLSEVQGMDISTRDVKGATALHYAAAEGNLQCLVYLVQNTPHLINDRAANGTTPTYLAAQNGHLGCLKYLVTTAGGDSCLGALDGMQPVHAAAQTGQLDCLVWLIQEQQVSSEVKDDDGATPLHFAAGRGHAQTVRWLLANGCQINRDNLGGIALHDAAEHGQVECARLLIQHGCDASEKDDDGFTPAELAKDCGHQKLAKYLHKEASKSKKKKLANAMAAGVTSDYSSPTNTAESFSSVVSDMDSTSSVFTDDEASSILNELSSTGSQYRVTESPTFAPEPLYMRLFEKLTEDEALSDFNMVNSMKGMSTTDTSASEASTLERDDVRRKKIPQYEIVHPHEYSEETLAKLRQAGHLTPRKDDLRSKFVAPSRDDKMPKRGSSPSDRSDSPPALTKIPSPSAITVVPEIKTNSAAFKSEGSARKMHLPLEPPTFTPPPPPVTPPPPLPIKTSPLHRRPLSHPFSNLSPSTPPPPPPPPPPAPLAPPLPMKSGDIKAKTLPSPAKTPTVASPSGLTLGDLTSVKLKPVDKDSTLGRKPVNGRQIASPGNMPDYVNADFLAEIRSGGTLKKSKTNKSQLGRGRVSPTSPSSPSRTSRQASASSSSTQSRASSAASSSTSSPTRSVAEIPKPSRSVAETPKTPDVEEDMPPWKIQFLAKKAAEKAKRDEAEQKQKDAEEQRYKDMPPWKAELFRRRDRLAKEYDMTENADETNEEAPQTGAEAEAKAKSDIASRARKPSPVRSNAPSLARKPSPVRSNNAPPPARKPSPVRSSNPTSARRPSPVRSSNTPTSARQPSPVRSSITARSPLRSPGGLKPWELEIIQARQGTQ